MKRIRLATLFATLLCFTTSRADEWPSYITDVVVLGSINTYPSSTYHDVTIYTYINNGYTVIEKDLNESAMGEHIYLAYKKGSRQSTNEGYITDFIVVNTSNPESQIEVDGFTYHLCPADIFNGDFDGNLNSGNVGWNLYLYYSKSNGNDYWVVSDISFNGTRDGSVDCYEKDGSLYKLYESGIDFNRGNTGSYIYMHLTKSEKTNRPSKDPVMSNGLVYNGEQQQLVVNGGTIDSGTMMFRVGDTGDFTSDITAVTAQNVGTHAVNYYASASQFSKQSDTHTQMVTIDKSPNSNTSVSCGGTLEQTTPSPVLTGNLSTGAVTYLYSSAEDGEYTTDNPSSEGVWWVKATIAGDDNCYDYTTAPAPFMATHNFLVHNSGDTEQDAYVLSSTHDLNVLAQFVNSGMNFTDKFFVLSNDIDYGGEENNYEAIGGEGFPFAGSFDGCGYTISGIRFTAEQDRYVGLFGSTSTSATVKNVVLSDCLFCGSKRVGSVVAYNRGTIRNCRVERDVNVFTGYNTAGEFGGIAGYNGGTVIGCTCAAMVSFRNHSADDMYFGGIAANNAGTIQNCIYTGTAISAMSHRGAVAATSSGTLTNNYYTAIVLGGLNESDCNGARRAIAINSDTGIDPVPSGEATPYDVSGITGYSGNYGISYNSQAYAGATETVILNLNYIVPEQHVVKEFTDDLGHTLTDNGDGTHTIIMYDKSPTIQASIYIPVTAETTFNNDVYTVNSDVTFTERIVISGNVKLIIEEGCTVTALKGIDVNSGNSLTIEGSGTLNATGSDYSAGIGGTTNYSANQSQHGRITINGCTVNATGGKDAAGIGGSNNSTADENSVITINGGVVNATGGSRGAGIGGGFRYWDGDGYGMPGTIIINGGQVTARKGEGACGIGKGVATTGDSGSLTMGWTNASDFIDVDSYNMPNISVANDKSLTDDTNIYVNTTPSSTLRALTDVRLLPVINLPLVLVDNGDNNSLIDTFDGQTIDVIFEGRKLMTNGNWNTLCLPFSLPTLSGTPLAGTKVKEFTSTSLKDGTLTLFFSDNLNSIEAGKPYIVRWNTEFIIDSADEWETFASNVNSGAESYEGKIVKLNTDDIRINSENRLVGTEEHPFKGIFNGQGHTLTYDFRDPTRIEHLAPFRYIDGATIQNLKVGGRIYMNQDTETGGLVSVASGTVTISNCVVSFSLTINYDGWGRNGSGGFMARVENGSNVTFNNCAFIGQIFRYEGYDPRYIGGFIGGLYTTDFNVTFNQCLFDPIYAPNLHDEYDLIPENNRVFSYYGNATYNKAYYKKAYDPNAPQGEYTDAVGSKLLELLGSDWQISGDKVVPKMNAPYATVGLSFKDVTIDNTMRNSETTYADFVGNYSPVVIEGEDRTMLYLGGDNNIYYPNAPITIKSNRGYFKLKGIEAYDPQAGVKKFVMNFEEKPTGIEMMEEVRGKMEDEVWYDMQGRKLSGKPTEKGIYINNGKKYVIK